VSDLTKEEAAWIKKVQRALNSCPSDRLGFFTIGDTDVQIYDKEKSVQIDRIYDGNKGTADFCFCVSEAEANLGCLKFPSLVESTAG